MRGVDRNGSPLSITTRTFAELSDVERITIVRRAQDGDLEAFESLVRSHQAPVFNLALRMLADRGDAEDITQEAILAAWEQLPKLKSPEAFSTWLFRLTSRRCVDLIRRREARPSDATEPEALSELVTAAQADPEHAALANSGLDALTLVLQTLPVDQRQIWILREMHDYSYEDIARDMGISTSTVRGRLARARRALAEGLEAWR